MPTALYSLVCLLLLFGSSISATAQHKDYFRHGYYTDLSGEKHAGLIRYTYDHKAKFKFKSTTDGKPKTLRPEQVRGFVVEADSFIVLRNFNFLGAGGGVHSIFIDFVQVIEPGAVSLVKHYSTQGNPSGGMYGGGMPFALETYLLVRSNNLTRSTHVPRNTRHFKKHVGAFFKDSPELLEAIAQETYSIENILQLVRRYNSQTVSQ